MDPPVRAAQSPAAAVEAAIAELLGRGAAVAVRSITGDTAVEPAEEAFVIDARAPRRREFAAGRRCARAALAALGGPCVAIGRGPLGEPAWPGGFTGSISHGRRLAAAAVRRSGDERSPLGIDLVDERDLGRFGEVAAIVLADSELRALGAGARDGRAIAARFAAKEAAVKVLSPRLARYIDPHELETFGDASALGVRAPGGVELATRGRWIGAVLVTVAWPRRQAPGTPVQVPLEASCRLLN